jgi:hypothetical protein
MIDLFYILISRFVEKCHASDLFRQDIVIGYGVPPFVTDLQQ